MCLKIQKLRGWVQIIARPFISQTVCGYSCKLTSHLLHFIQYHRMRNWSCMKILGVTALKKKRKKEVLVLFLFPSTVVTASWASPMHLSDRGRGTFTVRWNVETRTWEEAGGVSIGRLCQGEASTRAPLPSSLITGCAFQISDAWSGTCLSWWRTDCISRSSGPLHT